MTYHPTLSCGKSQSPARDVVLLTIEKYIEDGGKDVAYRINQMVETPPPQPLQPPISEHEFLKRCEEPGRLLYERLKAIAKEKGHEFKPATQAFSYYVTSKGSRFCLLTLWPTGLTIQKWIINTKLPPEATAKFREEIVEIRSL